MSIPNFKLILRWIRGINVFLGITSLIIIWNLRSISHYSSKKEHINPKNYWDWESQLGAGNLSRVVIQRPKSLMSGYEFCKETHSFYSILRVKRAELYLSPGIPNIEGVCPDPNLEIASISIATCCLIYPIIIMFLVGASKSDFSVFGSCVLETMFGFLLLSSVLIYYFYTDFLVEICYTNLKYAKQVLPAFSEYLQAKHVFIYKLDDGQIILENKPAFANESNYVPAVHKCKNEFKVLWRYIATLLAFLNVVGLFISAVVTSTCSSMREAVNNALEQEQAIDVAGDAGINIAEKAPAPLDHPDHFLHIFEDKQDDQMERNDSGSSLASISISIGKVESSLDFKRFSDTFDIDEDNYNAESDVDLKDNNNYEDELNWIQK